MSDSEQLRQGADQLPKVSAQEKAKQKKDRVDKMRQKLGIDKNINDEAIAAKESQIVSAQEKAIHDTEQQFTLVEGNVAEALVQAVESSGDGDLTTSPAVAHALQQAQQYHAVSTSKAQVMLKQTQEKYVREVFVLAS